jgi:hypothetical protein
MIALLRRWWRGRMLPASTIAPMPARTLLGSCAVLGGWITPGPGSALR